jgi:glycosyltransferase involved in cell wall biosynthesis
MNDARRQNVHVVHVINNLVVGGAERFLVLLADAQRKLGLHVEILSLVEPNPLAGELAPRGIPFATCGRRRLNDPRLLVDLTRLLRTRHPDVVHTHLFYADTFGRLAARAAGIHAVVGTEHSTEGAGLSSRRQLAMRHTASLAQRIVAVSDPVRQAAAARLGIAAERIEVIPNGIELAPWESALPASHAELGLEPGTQVIGTVGRLDDAKGYDVLIEAMARLDDPNARLVFVGDGPRGDALRELVQQRGLEPAVRFLGWRHDVPRLVAAFDVFAQPSRYEGQSIALLEAMAAGRACVLSDIPELVAVAGDAAERAQPGDPEALASALRRLLGDPAGRQQLGRKAREIARGFSIEASAARYADLYEVLVADSVRQPGQRRRIS